MPPSLPSPRRRSPSGKRCACTPLCGMQHTCCVPLRTWWVTSLCFRPTKSGPGACSEVCFLIPSPPLVTRPLNSQPCRGRSCRGARVDREAVCLGHESLRAACWNGVGVFSSKKDMLSDCPWERSWGPVIGSAFLVLLRLLGDVAQDSCRLRGRTVCQRSWVPLSVVNTMSRPWCPTGETRSLKHRDLDLAPGRLMGWDQASGDLCWCPEPRCGLQRVEKDAPWEVQL